MKILVIVDAQNDFITGSLGSKEAQRVLPNILEKINNISKTDTVLLTSDTHYGDYLDTNEGKNLPVKHCIIGTDGWDIHPDVIAALGDKYRMCVFKETFGSKHLEASINQISMLVMSEIEEIELIGYVLDICVISNALLLKSYFPEIPIKVDVSCCAATSPEAFEAAKIILKSCQIEVVGE